MVIDRWDPFKDLRRMEETMNRIWRGISPGLDASGTESWGIPLDVVEEGDSLVVHASLPGVKPGEIEVSIDNDVLTIKAKSHVEQERKEGGYLMRERRSGSFFRSLRLPDTVDPDKAKTVYEHGVLTISFPKHLAKRTKQLTVEVRDSGKELEDGKK